MAGAASALGPAKEGLRGAAEAFVTSEGFIGAEAVEEAVKVVSGDLSLAVLVSATASMTCRSLMSEPLKMMNSCTSWEGGIKSVARSSVPRQRTEVSELQQECDLPVCNATVAALGSTV